MRAAISSAVRFVGDPISALSHTVEFSYGHTPLYVTNNVDLLGPVANTEHTEEYANLIGAVLAIFADFWYKYFFPQASATPRIRIFDELPVVHSQLDAAQRPGKSPCVLICSPTRAQTASATYVSGAAQAATIDCRRSGSRVPT